MSDLVRKNVSMQPERWRDWEPEFEASGYTTFAEWCRAMVEAGRKGHLDVAVEPDETTADLREQRNDLKTELDRARARIDQLEDRLYDTDQAVAARYMVGNPDADFEEILNHILDTAPDRITRFLDTMESSTDGEFDAETDESYQAIHEASTLFGDVGHHHRLATDDSDRATAAEFLSRTLADAAEQHLDRQGGEE